MSEPLRVVVIISGGNDPVPCEIALEHSPAACSADEFAASVLGDGRVAHAGAAEIRRRIAVSVPPAVLVEV